MGGGMTTAKGVRVQLLQRANHVLLKDPDNNIKTTIFDINQNDVSKISQI